MAKAVGFRSQDRKEITMKKSFVVSGTMSVKGRAIKDVHGNIVGYRLKDGTIVKPIVVLEINKDSGLLPCYAISINTMRAFGFDLLEYGVVKFI